MFKSFRGTKAIKLNYKDIKTNVMKLNTKERQRIMALLQKQLGTI
jgi:hypothetical protein